MRCCDRRQTAYQGPDVKSPGYARNVIEVPPGERTHQMGMFFLNESRKTMYIRIGKRSMAVSHRKPAQYGVRKRA